MEPVLPWARPFPAHPGGQGHFYRLQIQSKSTSLILSLPTALSFSCSIALALFCSLTLLLSRSLTLPFLHQCFYKFLFMSETALDFLLKICKPVDLLPHRIKQSPWVMSTLGPAHSVLPRRGTGPFLNENMNLEYGTY